MASADSKIVKLVFIRVSDGSGSSRKAVVPLVEGCDYDMFVARVKRRLGVPDAGPITLSDAATGPVDSIDRLLEVTRALFFCRPANSSPPSANQFTFCQSIHRC